MVSVLADKHNRFIADAKNMNHPHRLITLRHYDLRTTQHGRLKVRTSEQELALKQKKQQERVVVYRKLMARIADKRQRDEYDDDMMEMTGQILAVSPDISTLWNVRRECLLRQQKECATTDRFRRDLEFTLLGLQSNPKSYCAWHHRRWCLETMAEPDWKLELLQCTQFLAKDERNCE